jgi:hypothetical protein
LFQSTGGFFTPTVTNEVKFFIAQCCQNQQEFKMLHCIQLEFYAPLENIIFTTHSMEKESQVQKKELLITRAGYSNYS